MEKNREEAKQLIHGLTKDKLKEAITYLRMLLQESKNKQ